MKEPATVQFFKALGKCADTLQPASQLGDGLCTGGMRYNAADGFMEQEYLGSATSFNRSHFNDP